MEQKYYQSLKDIEDMKGSKLLVFQIYLIDLGGLSWPRLCRKNESVFCVFFVDYCLSFFQLPMQSVPITTDVVSSNLDQDEV
jgi:hypothetical protein